MNYWLLKSEPNVWSIDQQQQAGNKGAMWDGVRNYQAANNLKKMKVGDLCFFYHSNIGKEIVGIVKVIKEFRWWLIAEERSEGCYQLVQLLYCGLQTVLPSIPCYVRKQIFERATGSGKSQKHCRSWYHWSFSCIT